MHLPDLGNQIGLPLFIGSALGLCISAWAILDAFIRTSQPSPSRRAFALWLPIALVVLVALFSHQPRIALTVIFSTSVAILSFVVGSANFFAPALDVPPIWRRLWLFILPVTILLFLIGLSGQFTFHHALILTLQGLILFLLWIDRPANPSQNATTPPDRLAPLRLIQFLIAIVVGGGAAFLVIHQAVAFHHYFPLLTPSLLSIFLLSPILTLPILLSSLRLAARNQTWAATTSAVGIVLLNLCLLLPLVIFLWHALPSFSQNPPVPTTQSTTLPATLESTPDDVPLPPLTFPLSLWRIDSLLLILLSLALLPAAINRWPLSRPESTFLIALYFLYLLLSLLLARLHI